MTPIKNKTLYNKELIMTYNKYYLSTYIKKNFLVISAISTVFIVYMLIEKQWRYALILFGVLIFYLILTFLMQSLTTKRILKRSPLVENPVMQTYAFREDDFDVVNMKTYKVSYSEITKFKKGKTIYLMHTADKKTFIIAFDGFESNAERERFEAFIQPKFNRKKG